MGAPGRLVPVVFVRPVQTVQLSPRISSSYKEAGHHRPWKLYKYKLQHLYWGFLHIYIYILFLHQLLIILCIYYTNFFTIYDL